MILCKKIKCVLLSLLFGCMLLLGIALIGMQAMGYRILAVQTGSMAQTYPVGTLLIVDASAPEKIAVGDVISFVADNQLTVVTHRVVEIDTENQQFYTKGDNNTACDSRPVLYKNLIGKVIAGIPYAGYAVLLTQTFFGKTVLSIAITIILFSMVWKLISHLMQKRRRHHNAPSVESNSKE